MESFRDYLRIKEAAELLGVSQSTLRNWGRIGKIPTYRHPVNGYRLFKRSDLEAILRQLALSSGIGVKGSHTNGTA